MRAVIANLGLENGMEGGPLRDGGKTSCLLPGWRILHRDRLIERDPFRAIKTDQPRAAERQVVIGKDVGR